jgi:hypothetical protein
MEKRKKTIILNLIGTYFLLLGITAILSSLHKQTPSQIFYICYIGMVLIGIGILTKRSFIILSQIYILAIPLLIWDIDFIHWIIFNSPLWGITDYFFLNLSATLDRFVSLQHLYTIPLSIYAVKLIGMKRKDAWKWSFIQIVVIFIAVITFSPQELNVNCIFYSCININYGLPYNLVWFLISFSMISITALFLNYFLWHKRIKIYRQGNFRKH